MGDQDGAAQNALIHALTKARLRARFFVPVCVTAHFCTFSLAGSSPLSCGIFEVAHELLTPAILTSRHSRVTHPTHFTSFTSYSPVLVAHGLLTLRDSQAAHDERCTSSRGRKILSCQSPRGNFAPQINRRLTRYSPAEVIHGSLTQDFALRRSRVTHPFRSLASYSPIRVAHALLTHSGRSRVTHPPR